MNRLLKTPAIASLVLASWSLAGCQPVASTPSKTTQVEAAGSEVATNLAKLSAEDRPLAEAQGYCAVESSEKLGSMGVPIKVMVKDQAVFVCCKGCEKKAVEGGDTTLAHVAELKAKVVAEKSATR